MTQRDFKHYIEKYANELAGIKAAAHRTHEQVNQTYDQVHPYSFHLDMVVDEVYKYGHEVCAGEQDVLPLFFGAYFHDSIEDARQSYNDVKALALTFMNDEQALMAAEIVYALTNEKGRTRAERAGEKYFLGIRETPYAPFVKLADRLANTTYSYACCNALNARMKDVYRSEFPQFLAAITSPHGDLRYSLPQDMVEELKSVVQC